MSFILYGSVFRQGVDMKTVPFSSGCGQEVCDLQLSELSDGEIVELRKEFSEHGLLMFRDQQFSPTQQLQFGERFGDIVVNKFIKTHEDHPAIAVVRKDKNQQTNIGGGWHTDHSDQLTGMDSVGDATHPVVILHPESGRKTLYVNPAHTIQFEGWGYAESRVLLDYLYAHVDQPQFTCKFNWLPGSVVLWDNRATWHFAQNDYQGQSRLMHRITLAGSKLAGV